MHCEYIEKCIAKYIAKYIVKIRLKEEETMIQGNYEKNCTIKKRGLFLRLTKKKIGDEIFTPLDIINAHLKFVDDGHPVWFSHSQLRSSEIERLIVFTWKGGEWFAAELFFDQYITKKTPFIPAHVSVENTPEIWAGVAEKCWVHVTGYEELNMTDLHQIVSSKSRTPLDRKIQERGFRASEFNL